MLKKDVKIYAKEDCSISAYVQYWDMFTGSVDLQIPKDMVFIIECDPEKSKLNKNETIISMCAEDKNLFESLIPENTKSSENYAGVYICLNIEEVEEKFKECG